MQYVQLGLHLHKLTVVMTKCSRANLMAQKAHMQGIIEVHQWYWRKVLAISYMWLSFMVCIWIQDTFTYYWYFSPDVAGTKMAKRKRVSSGTLLLLPIWSLLYKVRILRRGFYQEQTKRENNQLSIFYTEIQKSSKLADVLNGSFVPTASTSYAYVRTTYAAREVCPRSLCPSVAFRSSKKPNRPLRAEN